MLTHLYIYGSDNIQTIFFLQIQNHDMYCNISRFDINNWQLTLTENVNTTSTDLKSIRCYGRSKRV